VPADACAICALDNREEVEAEAALLVLEGTGSWLGMGNKFGINRQSLKNHMERHWVAPPSPTERALEGFDQQVADAIEGLLAQMAIAPPELKPFYAVAIQNLQHIGNTNPSQQNLLAALKGIHEVTGMKMEQRLMLEFGQKMFAMSGAPKTPALAPGVVIEVVAEETESAP
jgi:hypothetical protein